MGIMYMIDFFINDVLDMFSTILDATYHILFLVGMICFFLAYCEYSNRHRFWGCFFSYKGVIKLIITGIVMIVLCILGLGKSISFLIGIGTIIYMANN